MPIDDDSTRVCRHAHVSGRVQGVAFRYHAVEKARGLGLGGWVRNLADGRVEVWCEGEKGSVEEMLRWLSTGPPTARVSGLEVSEEEPLGHASFEIRRERY